MNDFASFVNRDLVQDGRGVILEVVSYLLKRQTRNLGAKAPWDGRSGQFACAAGRYFPYTPKHLILSRSIHKPSSLAKPFFGQESSPTEVLPHPSPLPPSPYQHR